VELSSDLRAPGRGRALVAPFLRDAPPDRARDAEILVSELVTNAVIHANDADEPVHLLVAADEMLLHVEVHDGGPGVPEQLPAAPDETRTSGRGLALVRGLSDRWGVDRGPSRVWFELELRDPDPA
jgi:anti-sigma regulatory factor (Ser/Thr protein kinase)